METVDDTPKRRGGSRPGAGRPRNRMMRSRHTVYCSSIELDLVKALLQELRKVSKLEEKAHKVQAGISEKYGKGYTGALTPRDQYTIDKYLEACKALDALTVKDLNAIADAILDARIGISDADDE